MNNLKTILSLTFLILVSTKSWGITNGKQSDPSTHPWLVKIDTCAGAIISTRAIITAAHCVADKTVGLVTLKINDGTRLKRAKAIHVHPDYVSWKESNVKRHDIAIIETSENIHFQNLVSPISLIDGEQLSTATIAGWGRIEDGSYPRNPHQAENLKILPRIENPFWNDSKNSIYLESDDDQQNFLKSFESGDFLAIKVDQNLQQSACRGDSGAPVVTNRNQLIGLVSHGSEDCLNQRAFFATDIVSHDLWINETLSKIHEIQ